MSQTLREQHVKTLRVFNEVNNVGKTLRQQIIEAVQPSYLEALCNRQTNSITLSICGIIQHLYDTYGNIAPKSLQDYKDRTKQMMFDPIQPIDNVFNAVVNLADYADAARAPYSQQQTINTTYNVLAHIGKNGKWMMSSFRYSACVNPYIQSTLYLFTLKAIRMMTRVSYLRKHYLKFNVISRWTHYPKNFSKITKDRSNQLMNHDRCRYKNAS